MRRLLASLPLLIAATAAVAQSTPPTATLKFDKPTAAAGAVVKGTLTITFADGLHGYQNPPTDEYQIPLTVKVIEKGFKLIKVSYPKGEDYTGSDAKTIKVYKGTISVPVEIKAGAKPATYDVNVEVNYQQCNDNACFPPGQVVAKGRLVVAKPPKVTAKKG